MDELLSNALRQLLREQCTPQRVRETEAGKPAEALWRSIEDSGFANAMLTESQGGAGLGLAEAFSLFELCGEYAVPAPLSETLLARGLLAQAQASIPPGSITLAQGQLDSQGNLQCDSVRCGQVARWVLVRADQQCWLLPSALAHPSAAVFALDANLRWSAQQLAQVDNVNSLHDTRTLQACIYAAQISGALNVVFQSTLQFANERQQFGRSIGKFQAIQHQLSVMSEHCFAARAAAQIGCQTPGLELDRLKVAVAKARSSEAALEVAALSHSIHGAVGFTEELDLQLFTRRLHLWRQAGGSESYWHQVLGAELVIQRQGSALDLIRHLTDFA